MDAAKKSGKNFSGNLNWDFQGNPPQDIKNLTINGFKNSVDFYNQLGLPTSDAIIINGDDMNWVKQEPQLGTGHAVKQDLPILNPRVETLVLLGDVPAIQPETLNRLISAAKGGLAVLTVRVDQPTGYGRIVREGRGDATGAAGVPRRSALCGGDGLPAAAESVGCG